MGAFLLFLTNLVGIILSADVIFLWQSYGSWKRSIWTLCLLIITMIVISFPLNSSFQKMMMDNLIRHALNEFDRRYNPGIKGYIKSVKVEFEGDAVFVLVDVVREPLRPDEINNLQERLEFIRDFLSKKVNKPVHLEVRALPIDIVDYEVLAPATEAN